MTSLSRVIKNEIGTWLSSWHSVENTPPMEDRVWTCQKCFEKWHDFMAKVPPSFMIAWNSVAREVGPERAERFHSFLQNHRVRVWERVERVHELELMSPVNCRSCSENLNNAATAFVEVY